MPAWVADESIWEKAKDAAEKTYGTPESPRNVEPGEGETKKDAWYKIVTMIYKNMGGKVKKESARIAAEALRSKSAWLARWVAGKNP